MITLVEGILRTCSINLAHIADCDNRDNGNQANKESKYRRFRPFFNKNVWCYLFLLASLLFYSWGTLEEQTAYKRRTSDYRYGIDSHPSMTDGSEKCKNLLNAFYPCIRDWSPMAR